MNRLIIPYSILIIVLCFGTTLLILSSPHHVDTDLLVINTASLVIFPLTVYFLNKTYFKSKQVVLTLILLTLTGCIQLYYIRDLFNDENGISSIILLPLAVLLLTLLFLKNIFAREKAATK
jgi:hypothetical protein